ncbi:MAG TPA: ATP-binding protein [Flavobacterium sp.]|jgi:signal transduction histidine kinase
MPKTKVLLIDSDPNNIRLVSAALQSLEITIITAKTFSDAIKLMSKNDFALVLAALDKVEPTSLSEYLDQLKDTNVVFMAKELRDEELLQLIGNNKSTAIVFHPSIIYNTVQFHLNGLKQKLENDKHLLEYEKLKTALAETINEFDSFGYIVSHDLRAPLRALNGYSQILIEDHQANLGPAAIRMLDRIKSNVSKLERLLDDLLEFSRVNRAELKKEQVDMEKLVRSAHKSLKHKFDLQIADLKPAYGDKQLLQQLWMHLVSNSVKFSKQDESINIEVGSTTDEDQQIYFIKDNGIGIDMQYASKVFDVFKKLHNASDYEGNGMGLAVAKSILSKHNGKIWVESEVDAGTTVYFTIPRKS